MSPWTATLRCHGYQHERHLATSIKYSLGKVVQIIELEQHY
ncbi:hypothetical protein NX722_08940 [Endozoicomonas gorgoniicola]|uniref:Uncharacterized protein n=1 Tax=Endozoicomonas gorgoniicola TaxID=1234144 RepID=A0ABT3MTP9_9GAMM|nr:hypothetical protein [Endozoicomonas gorgoniicola]MCW7552765.1 hypothetical protein [Endozoicomonas gorgoniicola]